MTRDITPIVQSWLAETIDPVPAPTRLYRSVAVEVHRTPQQRGWLPPIPAGKRRAISRGTGSVVAAAVVVLAGGVLVTGVGPHQTVEIKPGTAPALALVTEPVPGDPGVERVISDGIHDLAPQEGKDPFARQVIGPDGSIWRWAGQTLVRLGDPAIYSVAELNVQGSLDARIAPDGALWVWDDSGLWHMDGNVWTVVSRVTDPWLWDMARDGTIWWGWPTEGPSDPPVTAGVSRLDGSTWTRYPIDLDLEQLIGDQIAGAYEGTEASGTQGGPNGEVWLKVRFYAEGASNLLMRFDGQRWSVADPLGAGLFHDYGLLDVDTNGTLWVYIGPDAEDGAPSLARLVGDQWTVWSEADGVLIPGDVDTYAGHLEVGPDGTVWTTQIPDHDRTGPTVTCRGLRAFDGTAWRRYLDGQCVLDVDIAPDGTVWAIGGTAYFTSDMPSWPLYTSGATYLINPDAGSDGS